MILNLRWVLNFQYLNFQISCIFHRTVLVAKFFLFLASCVRLSNLFRVFFKLVKNPPEKDKNPPENDKNLPEKDKNPELSIILTTKMDIKILEHFYMILKISNWNNTATG